MRPLILHNVPDEELYTGEDGVQRPYAMIFPEAQPSVARARKPVTETGSFGKSTRRSRSRTGSAAPKREDATMKHADELFSNYIASAEKSADAPSGRNLGYGGLGQAQDDSSDPSTTKQAPRFIQVPTEVILRGYQSPEQQYASINHFEQLAGRICEDYPREPPIESRRYKSELRDPAYTRRQPLTAAERARVSRVAGGEHWVKVTFESADAADAAIYASPQKILGHLIYAEPFHGMPPKEDAAVLEIVGDGAMFDPFATVSSSFGGGDRRRPSQQTRWSTPALNRRQQLDQHTPESQSSTQTIDTATASTATVTGTDLTQQQHQQLHQLQGRDKTTDETNGTYCRVIPTARRVTLKPAEEALAPQASALERLLAKIPLIGWFSGSIIGSQVPRNDNGDFDMAKASLYWVIMFYLDLWFGLFGRELVSGDKDD
ncbi:uncharacterized protein B0I36DRAFT_358890 [Microdochium trichocladiopsis]|uniref:Nup53p-like protein n=1 Tax=Microdochium trichocladiopsis TaxID=1682393 RepID=A0A9P8YDS4_9PEZI|nr:uncharacterized protein B0I36DRAFT_358890 [Microdochium trichocladiopsis]KAH7037146.1 hypothetical protein B0I36DRAFT_358890 [Microdochium trichocladiopsis]